MFTGIVEEVGEVISVDKDKDSFKLKILGQRVLEDLKTGDSISTNGVCLTVTSFDKTHFIADVMPETLRRSNLRYLKPKVKVNLERALRLSDRLGGHLVSGHVDGLGKVTSRKREGNAEVYHFTIVEHLEKNINRYLVEKGSIAVDGISLTIVECGNNWFSVSVIPHSKENTVLDERRVGDYVNIEIDMIGKYVEKLIYGDRTQENKEGEDKTHSSRLDMNRLRELGY